MKGIRTNVLYSYWSEDSGLLTEKKHLPVKQLRFGDVGVHSRFDEVGYHTLGKFKCYGLA